MRNISDVNEEYDQATSDLDEILIKIQINMVAYRDFKDLADLPKLQIDLDYLMCELDRARRYVDRINREKWNIENGSLVNV